MEELLWIAACMWQHDAPPSPPRKTPDQLRAEWHDAAQQNEIYRKLGEEALARLIRG